MRIKVVRKYFPDTYTIGNMFLDDKFFCDTLEDRIRALPEEQKIYGQTAIPFGSYRVIMSYSPRFQRLLPELLNVPYFEDIRIHSGNTNKDTEGCILVGKNDVKGMVTNSRLYSDTLNTLIEKTLETDNVWIDIIR